MAAGTTAGRSSADNIQPIVMPNPRDVRIAQLEARVRELEQKLAARPC
jgi:hypothetical protein